VTLSKGCVLKRKKEKKKKEKRKNKKEKTKNKKEKRKKEKKKKKNTDTCYFNVKSTIKIRQPDTQLKPEKQKP
jgi:hypothetical protein